MNIEELDLLTSRAFDLTELPLQLKDGDYTYKLDNKAKWALNKTLDTDFKAVYRQEGHEWETRDIDWSGERVYAVTAKGNVVRFTNSELAFFKKVSK